MGVRITSQEDRVAIFDSVSGFAFGPTFSNTDDAQSFLDYIVGMTPVDVRQMSDRDLETLFRDWESHR